MHEKSVTEERDGRWINAYGPGTMTPGKILPPLYDYERESYDTEPEASAAAKRRSEDHGKKQHAASHPMLTDPDFLALPPDRQAKLQQEALGHFEQDPDYLALKQRDPAKAEGLWSELHDSLFPLPTPEQEAVQDPPEGQGILRSLSDPGTLLDPFNLGAGAGAGVLRGVKGAVKGVAQAASGLPGAVVQFGQGLVKGLTARPPLAPPPAATSTAPPTLPVIEPVDGPQLGLGYLEDLRKLRPGQQSRLQFPELPASPPSVVHPPSSSPVPPAQSPVQGPQIPILSENMTPDAFARVTRAGTAYFTEHPEAWDKKFNVTDNILREWVQGKLDHTWLERHGLQPSDLATLIKVSSRESAQRLAHLSWVRRHIDGNVAKQLREADPDLADDIAATSLWRRSTNIWRGALVSQLGTAVRNFMTQTGRVGMDVFDAALESGMQNVYTMATGKAPVKRVDPLDGFEVLANIFTKGTKKEVEQLLKNFPDERDRLLLTYSSDVRITGGATDTVLGKAEAVVHAANIFNRFQERLIRRGIFEATLGQDLRNRGLDLDTIIKNNSLGQIPPESIHNAVSMALEKTFAAQPKGDMGRAVVDFFTKTPMVLTMPFPRFMVNSLRYITEHSPAGFLRLASPEVRQEIANGNMEALAKATTGSAMLFAGYEFRNSEYAGEKWYEAKGPNGEVIDMRPFNPFSAYLFIGDLYKRHKAGTLSEMDLKDMLMGVAGVNLRAGTGLYAVESLWKVLTAEGGTAAEKYGRIAKEFAGETVAGLATPLNQIADALGEFDRTHRILHETRTDPFLGPIKEKIPGLRGTLPEKELPTREGAWERVHPFLYRHMLGMSVSNPKNPIEERLDALDFKSQEILPPTSDPRIQINRARVMGPLLEQLDPRALDGLDRPGQQLMLRGLLETIRSGQRPHGLNLGIRPGGINPFGFEGLTPEDLKQHKLEKIPRKGRGVYKEK